MSKRITVKQVRGTWEHFVREAGRAGFDTQGWVLQEGSSTYGRSYSHFRRDPDTGGLNNTPFRSYLGMTAREAYDTLSTRIDTLYALADEWARRAASREG